MRAQVVVANSGYPCAFFFQFTARTDRERRENRKVRRSRSERAKSCGSVGSKCDDYEQEETHHGIK
jgi:hypothetical protein